MYIFTFIAIGLNYNVFIFIRKVFFWSSRKKSLPYIKLELEIIKKGNKF